MRDAKITQIYQGTNQIHRMSWPDSCSSSVLIRVYTGQLTPGVFASACFLPIGWWRLR
jgi:hypothetical protein